jgi:hypothetical protein
LRNPVKISLLLLLAILPGFPAFNASATTYYVDVNSTNPTPPYTNWSIASTDIQSAINQTTNGDLVLVNPGVYQTGEEITGLFTNGVLIADPITVQSVSGPLVTTIEGYPIANTNGIRCVFMTNGASLTGFSIVGGNVPGSMANGGGIFCLSSNDIVSNCVITACSAGNGGGGYLGSYYNCIISNNFATDYGGGICLGGGSVMYNCLVYNNTFNLMGGGGVYCIGIDCFMDNCTIVQNHGNLGGPGGAGVYGGS